MWWKVASTDTQPEMQTCDRHPDTAASGRTITDDFLFAKIPRL